ncbi:hypothetical protein ACIBEJ_30685 [Nonomuraea sp. NPDC050790]|uniref:hypothetical protein n=1 Tax=Nonomuraea sp. NPDC050790 TaxID=3364371 RepID=UPI0037BDEBC2
MGNFYDYYRATDRHAAVAKPHVPRAVEQSMRGHPVFDAVDAKWIDPEFNLGQLIACIRGVPYAADLVKTIALYPPPEHAPVTDEEWDALPEDSPYLDGPGIDELSAEVRDALADVPDDHLPVLGARWAQVVNFVSPPDPGDMAALVTELRDLAQRARSADQQLYCWMSA